MTMDCPQCHTPMVDVTDSWHTFVEARGAEYLASYVTIWDCPTCHTLAGTADEDVEWVMRAEGAAVPE